MLAIIFFGVLSAYSVDVDGDPAAGESPQTSAWLLATAFWLFLAAALGDWLDGYLARRLGQVTAFGRVVDPVVDKVMVLGAFIYFSSAIFVDPVTGKNVTGVAPWMAVIVLLRELFVSAVRAFKESQGEDFPASWPGKIKMTVQAATVCIVLGTLAWFGPVGAWLRTIAVWATVVVTLGSLVPYMRRAYAGLLSPDALGARGPAPRPPARPMVPASRMRGVGSVE